MIGDPRHEVGGGRGLRVGGVRGTMAAALRPGLRLAVYHPTAPAGASPRETLAVAAGNLTALHVELRDQVIGNVGISLI